MVVHILSTVLSIASAAVAFMMAVGTGRTFMRLGAYDREQREAHHSSQLLLAALGERLDLLDARIRRLHGRVYASGRVGPSGESAPASESERPIIDTQQNAEGDFEATMRLQSAPPVRPS